jgi:hypothetical protein
MRVTHLPKGEICGINVTQNSSFTLFSDELLRVIDIYVGWKHNLERRRIAIYETPYFAK